IISDAREVISNWIGCSDPKHVLLYSNATVALNQAIKRLKWKRGDHVITTTFKHNAVRKTLECIKREYGINISYINGNTAKDTFINKVKQEISDKTKLLVINHASNVTCNLLTLKDLTSLTNSNHYLSIISVSFTIVKLPNVIYIQC